MPETLKVEIFYDYGCPYVYGAAMWLRDVKKVLGDKVDFVWRSFPLEQVNSAEGPEWKVWEQPADFVSRGRPAFHGAIAARQQGEDAFLRYHYGALIARHEQDRNLSRREAIVEVAQSADLDLPAFEAALDDYSILSAIGEDYEHAREAFGVFGTPTFVFPNGESAYLKMRPPAPTEDAMDFWNSFVRTVIERPYISEIKRPQK